MRSKLFDDLSQLENLGNWLHPATARNMDCTDTSQSYLAHSSIKQITIAMKRWLDLPQQLVKWVAMQRIFRQWGNDISREQAYLFGEDEIAYVSPVQSADTSSRPDGQSASNKESNYQVYSARSTERTNLRANLVNLAGKEETYSASGEEMYLASGEEMYSASGDETQHLSRREKVRLQLSRVETRQLADCDETQYVSDQMKASISITHYDETQYFPYRRHVSTQVGQRIEGKQDPQTRFGDSGISPLTRQTRMGDIGIGSLTLLCTLCSAEFIPSPLAPSSVRQNSQVAEQAFLQLCHTCSACGRIACPCCWNAFYQRCSHCAQAAGLPAQLPTALLERMTTSSQFVCMSLGKFQLKELERGQRQLANSDLADGPAEEADERPPTIRDGLLRQLRQLEYTLTILVSLLICAIVIISALALCFEPCNTLFAYWLHVDFRREIAFYLHLLQLFHA